VIPPPDIGYQLAGYTDGEGCFHIKRQKARRGRVNYACEFVINVRWDDREALEFYREQTGIGTIYFVKRGNYDVVNAQPLARWATTRRAECVEIVSIFERYPLRTKKARDFAIWAQAVRYWNSDRPEGIAPLARWYQDIRDVRVFDPHVLPEVPEHEPIAALFEWEAQSQDSERDT
jgi:hypothetical protein